MAKLSCEVFRGTQTLPARKLALLLAIMVLINAHGPMVKDASAILKISVALFPVWMLRRIVITQ
jgi:hypothetical protein